MRHFLVFTFACVLSACSSVGRPISHAERDQIIKGVTTREELEQRFGPSTIIAEGADGNELASWTYVRSGFLGLGYKGEALGVRFDASGKVIDVLFTERSKPMHSK
ncbi:hypothetical protein HX793_09260 [Pseudomonas reactans]|uniref:hypothetical protein n=1 Tax=Pseudomonas reactans TaxID=117680 RepID=UPI0015B87BBC|nr:hypothetical protein [Pseudomonas reactans]NWD29958.1 hypothetical protein [Pseudomonas reactans]